MHNIGFGVLFLLLGLSALVEFRRLRREHIAERKEREDLLTELVQQATQAAVEEDGMSTMDTTTPTPRQKDMSWKARLLRLRYIIWDDITCADSLKEMSARTAALALCRAAFLLLDPYYQRAWMPA